ncbi:MAG TPA: ATPase [Peptococcaceae bacterium]|nr:ATPase [Peptococcaceae bacterium]
MPGKIKRVFPGGNTSEGFFSYYRYLLEKGTRRTFIIKGGPGVGKSTLMKRIGQKMVDLGYDVEFHHCSSDNRSLDGIAILEAGIVMVDGTAPHIIDPKYPGGLDEIINMGEFWDLEAMERNTEKIIASTQEVSRLFARAYGFLRAARPIAENLMEMHRCCMDFAEVNKITEKLEKDLLEGTYLPESKNSLGKERHLFSSAYTPEGHIDFTDSILQGIERVYFLEGPMGTGKSTLMQKIAAKAIQMGQEVEIYHTPLIPTKIGTVLLKNLSFALTASSKMKNNCTEVINFQELLDGKKLKAYQEDIAGDSRLLEDLINNGIKHINKAKAEHDVLEQYYIPHMDFAALEKKQEELFQRILGLAEGKLEPVTVPLYN